MTSHELDLVERVADGLPVSTWMREVTLAVAADRLRDDPARGIRAALIQRFGAGASVSGDESATDLLEELCSVVEHTPSTLAVERFPMGSWTSARFFVVTRPSSSVTLTAANGSVSAWAQVAMTTGAVRQEQLDSPPLTLDRAKRADDLLLLINLIHDVLLGGEQNA